MDKRRWDIGKYDICRQYDESDAEFRKRVLERIDMKKGIESFQIKDCATYCKKMLKPMTLQQTLEVCESCRKNKE